MGTRNILLVALGMIVFVSCSVPIYDRAEITPGPVIIGGIGLGTGFTASGPPQAPRYPFAVSELDYYLDLIGTMRLGSVSGWVINFLLQGSTSLLELGGKGNKIPL
jgi:hypothetical protein